MQQVVPVVEEADSVLLGLLQDRLTIVCPPYFKVVRVEEIGDFTFITITRQGTDTEEST